MLAKVIRLARYKVVVLSLKPKKGHPIPSDDAIFVHEQDHFFGRSYRQHRVGKYFDLWFTHPREDDPDNFITFGRIIRIQQNLPSGWVYTTKLGKFLVEEMKHGTQENKKEKDKGNPKTSKNRSLRNKINLV